MMELVQLNGGRAVTNSIWLAESFGKRHDHVLRDIRKLPIPDDFRRANFVASSVERMTPTGGRFTTSCQLITRSGFDILAMSYTGKRAIDLKIAFIDAFNRVSDALKKETKKGGATNRPTLHGWAMPRHN